MRINDQLWYEKFLDPNTRDKIYDSILSTETVPRGENQNEPIKLVRIRRSNFATYKRKK